MKKINRCDYCGENFENAFEMVDHFVEEDDAAFDPYLLMPNGYKLMVGSLLRSLFHQAENPKAIRRVTEDVYTLLYSIECDPLSAKDAIHEAIVNEKMEDIDIKYKELCEDEGGNSGRTVR